MENTSIDKLGFKPCFTIPVFNHNPEPLLQQLSEYQLPVIVVDDGSDREYQRLISQACSAHNAELVRYKKNGGKGFAVKTGFKIANLRGFSHAIQVDADMQHDLTQIVVLLQKARQTPGALISGLPVFDASVPSVRKLGRYATHVWVWINTCSLQIKDSMCGFRIYPLDEIGQVQRVQQLGDRMDFDTDVMVQFYRYGFAIQFIPCEVTYPEGGASHFRPFKDNLSISLMHARHFFTLPLWWWRVLFKTNSNRLRFE